MHTVDTLPIVEHNTMTTQPNALNMHRILCFLVAVVTYQSTVDAFVVSPRAAITTAPSRHQSPLFVVADPPREEEKKRFSGDDDANDDAWVATSNGGFLPKLPGLRRRLLKREPQTKPTEVLTIQEYKAVVADEKGQMVCVRFYAPWCKACKAIQQPFRKLCRDYPAVKFVEVPLTKENAFLHEGLGIPSLPYGHIYHPQAGLVEEHKIKKKEFADFAHILDTYSQGECQVEYEGGVCRQHVN